MKILVMSLLRMGDFVQIIPVLNGLKSQFAKCDIDVLVYKSTASLQPMLPLVKHWHVLDRELLQTALGRADVPLLTSFSLLKEQMDEINSHNYDLIINLTQTVQSGWLAGYLEAGRRLGLVTNAAGQSQFHSPWFRHLNENLRPGSPDVFHYADLFFYGSGLTGASRQWSLRETRHGYAEVMALNLPPSNQRIVLQCLTSDVKKNWSEENWVSLVQRLRKLRPHAQFVALGSPHEAPAIAKTIERAAGCGVVLYPAIVSLEGAHSLLLRTQLLLTGDTGIKHLALASNVKIVELSLGSSDLYRTGAYAPDSLILRAQTECGPCPHSSPCSQVEHTCGSQLKPEVVAEATHLHLQDDWTALSELARQNTPMQLFRTRVLKSGFWWPLNLAGVQRQQTVRQLINQVGWKLQLGFNEVSPLLAMGSESLSLRREFDSILPQESGAELQQELRLLESEEELVETRAFELLETVNRRAPALGQIQDFLKSRGVATLSNDWLATAPPDTTQLVVNIEGLRRLQSELLSQGRLAQLKSKLIRNLRTQTME